MMKLVPTGFAALLSVLPLSSRAVTGRNNGFSIRNPIACCSILREAGLKHVYTPSDRLYEKRVESYWSVTSQLTPYCFIQPEDAQEVSLALTTLTKETECNFAVRSGGHSSVPGANNIEQGVTIDLGLLHGTTYDPQTGIAGVLTGTRWHNVYTHLEKYGVAVAGGRLGHVGVGGFLTGGGCSYYMFQVGFGCDNVVNFEIVLSNGDIINANAYEHADLWHTLKGGGRVFGIITRFDLRTFSTGAMWGGSQSHKETEATTRAYVSALKHWVDNLENYQVGSANIFWSYRLIEKESLIIAGMVDTSGKVEAPAFQEFRSISGKVADEMQMTNLSALSLAEQAEGLRNIWWSLTFKNDERLIRKNVDLHHQLVKEMKKESSDDEFETQCFFQPLPTIIAQHGAERGGNILGLERLKENAIVLLASIAVNGEDQERLARGKMMEWKRKIEEYSKSVNGLLPFIYMNYADGPQDVIGHYGRKNVDKMRKVARKYDPEGIFHTREPGGFKIPNFV